MHKTKLKPIYIFINITNFMQRFGLLMYYSISFSLVVSLHTNFHKKYYGDNCKACRSHSYVWSLIIFLYTIVIGFVTMYYVKNYQYIVFILALVGTLPLFPLYSIIDRPILISSITVWIFCMMIALVTSVGMIINSIDINQLLSKLATIGVVIAPLTAFIGIMAAPIFNLREKNGALHIIFSKGAYYIVISTLIVLYGTLFFILLPLTA